jgi:hypothetical protein
MLSLEITTALEWINKDWVNIDIASLEILPSGSSYPSHTNDTSFVLVPSKYFHLIIHSVLGKAYKHGMDHKWWNIKYYLSIQWACSRGRLKSYVNAIYLTVLKGSKRTSLYITEASCHGIHLMLISLYEEVPWLYRDVICIARVTFQTRALLTRNFKNWHKMKIIFIHTKRNLTKLFSSCWTSRAKALTLEKMPFILDF